MNKSIENMMNEHRLIVQVLGSLDTLVLKLQADEVAARQDVAKFATFFREFADKLHHGKEEDRLFVKMNEAGFPREYGPVAVMLAEHDAGRAHVRALAEVGGGSGPLSAEERQLVIHHGGEFVPLLLGHIQKEDNILYPMAQQAIPPAAFQKLDQDCEAFDQDTVGQAGIERLKALAAEVIQSYPADPARLAAAQACLGCAGHHA
jgi:hemerythrin-like domain-containing protein